MGEVAHINQRRELEQLARFAQQAGPAIDHLLQEAGKTGFAMDLLLEMMRRTAAPDVPAAEWCAMYKQVEAEMAACCCVANGLRSLALVAETARAEAEKSRAWREKIAGMR